LPTTPFCPHQFLECHLSDAADANQCNSETHQEEGSQNETKLQERLSMLRALRIDLSDRKGWSIATRAEKKAGQQEEQQS
jgi:hypothetical protein